MQKASDRSILVTLVLTSSRSVTGVFPASNKRLSDALNNRLESMVRLSNAQLGRLGNPSATEPVEVAVVPKPQVVLAYDSSAGPAGTDARFYAYVQKQSAELLVLAAGLRITGTAHGLGVFDATDLQQVLQGGDDHFLPVTNVTIALDVEGTKCTTLPFVLLNLRHVQFIARRNSAPHATTAGEKSIS